MARYLYADSESFPYAFDFLSTLKGFLRAATESLEAIGEIEQLEESLRSENSRVEAAERAIEVFVDAITDHVDLAIGRNPEPGTVEVLGRALQDFLKNAASGVKNDRRGGLERHANQLARSSAVQRGRIREALQSFFLRCDLEVHGSRLDIRLSGDKYESSVECRFPEGVVVRYALAAKGHWGRPQRVADLAGRVSIQVGMKKRFLSRDLTREVAQLDEMIVGGLSIFDDGMEISLRKRPELPDTMTLKLRRASADAAVAGTVIRPDREDRAFPIADEDRQDLARVWEALAEAIRPLLLERDRVLEARLEGGDLFEVDTAAQFIELYVALLAPTVWEVARRSPSRKELSLKLEHDDGRREELYLRREELSELLGGLDERKAKVFAPLDILPAVEVSLEADVESA